MRIVVHDQHFQTVEAIATHGSDAFFLAGAGAPYASSDFMGLDLRPRERLRRAFVAIALIDELFGKNPFIEAVPGIEQHGC